VTDDDTQVVVINPSTLGQTEGDVVTANVTLGFMPAANTTVTLASSDPTVVTISPSTLTFTPANYATAQTVTVTFVEDTNPAWGPATITGSTPGATDGTLAVTARDNDTQQIVVSQPTLALAEGAFGTVNVRLTFVPDANVTVTLTSGNASVATVAPTTLTFTPANYNTNQAITITAPQDIDLVANTTTVTASAPGANSGTVTVNTTDNDTQAVRVSTGTVALTEGTSTTFGVTLDFAPAANVTVTLTSANGLVATTSPATLTFTPTNYATSQSVTVTAPHDVDLVAGSTTITASAPSATSGTVTVNVTDDDTQIVLFNLASTTVNEGGSNTAVGVRLGFQPAANVTVVISFSAEISATPGSLTFTPANYATNQFLTITAPNDIDVTPESATVTGTASGATSGSVAVTVIDNDTQAINTSTAVLGTLGEAASTSFTVSLAFQPAANTTVTVSSNDTTAISVSPTTLTFTPADYATPQTVTVAGVADADTVHESVTITVASTGLTSRTVGVQQYDNDLLENPANMSGPRCGFSNISFNLVAAPLASITVNASFTTNNGSFLYTTSRTYTTANWATGQIFDFEHGGTAGSSTVTFTASGQTSQNVLMTTTSINGCL